MLKRFLMASALSALAWALLASDVFQEIAAGVAIFLFGMVFLEQGFGVFSGGALQRVLKRSTSTLPRSLAFGTVTTTFMQSSSLVSVLTISFISAGLIGLTQGIGIIFGANLGTTTGAWLMAGFGMKVKISAFAMPMLVFGLIFSLQKSRKLKGVGHILAGMGFLFLGIHFMKEGFQSVSETIDLAEYALSGVGGLIVFTLIGAMATVIMQSSHATLMLIIAALAAGQITYENALALAIGANIGTTVTAVLGSLGANIAGRRLAGAHLVFNFVTGLVALIGIIPLSWLVEKVSAGVGIAYDDWTLKLAVFHTIFNLLGVMIMSPMIALLVRFLERAMPEKKAEDVLYLNDAALLTPDTAMEVVYKEAEHLFDHAFEIIAHGVQLHRKDILSSRDLDEVIAERHPGFDVDVIHQYYGSIKTIYSAIVEFSTRAEHDLYHDQREAAYSIRIACRNIARAVKLLPDIIENLNQYLSHPNEQIRVQYNLIRRDIGATLRALYQVRASDAAEEILLIFAQLVAVQRESDAIRLTKIEDLVRTNEITSQMATSLMNDSAIAADIMRLLVEAGKRLFVSRDATTVLIGDALIGDVLEEGYEALQSIVDGSAQRRSLTGEYRRMTRDDNGD